MIYTVTFNPAIDYVVFADGIKFGKTNRSIKEELMFGGKGINVSIVLQTLGCENTALGFIAGFTGEALEKDLKLRGINTDFIKLESGMTRINVKLKGQVETEINATGPEIDTASLDRLLAKLDTLTENDVLVLAGSVPKTLPDDVYEKILQRVEKNNVKAVVDAEGELLVRTLKYHPYLVKPNRDELEGVFGRSLKNDNEIKAAAEELRVMGAINVLVTLGADGALLVDEFGISHRVHGKPITAVNTVGAGDSAVAGFLYGARGGYDMAVRYAVACGTASSSLPHLADLQTINLYL